jgi:hypothetical protein
MAKRTSPKRSKDVDFGKSLERFAPKGGQDVAEDQRLHLVQREPGGSPLLIYATDRGINVELRVEVGSFWATQAQMADIFGITQQAISQHILNIHAEGELPDDDRTHKKVLLVRREGDRDVRREIDHYDLNTLIAVGYRISGRMGTMFRIWATDKLFRYLAKGFVIDVERLKSGDAEQTVIDELRDTIREIRAATVNVYREVKRMCALCSDYDSSSQAARDFFADMENKLLWVATSQTAAELILARADASKPQMGLTCYAGKRGPTQKDVVIANNYLAEPEATRKSRVTVMLLDYFEEQLDQGRLVTMAEARAKLVEFIKFNRWPLLTHYGRASREDADTHALAELSAYKARSIEE